MCVFPPLSATPAGLYLASMAVHMHSAAQRFVPEALSFAVLLLQGVLPAAAGPAAAGGVGGSSHQRQLTAEEPRWLAITAADAGCGSLPATADEIAPLDLLCALGSGAR